MGREIRGEIWIWRLMAWLLCYVLCPALLQSNLKVTLWFLLPQSIGPLHKLSLSYGILVYVCTNALDWRSFAILDLSGGRSILRTDVGRPQSIETWSRSLWEMMGLRVGLVAVRNRAKSLFTVQTLRAAEPTIHFSTHATSSFCS